MASSDLPPDFRAVAEAEIDLSLGDLRHGTEALTETYKAGGKSAETMNFAAYLAARLPATFAAVYRALDHLAEHVPKLAPSSVLDAGSGPGTAAWAAIEAFDSITSVRFLDSNRAFLNLALKLAKSSERPALRAAEGHLGDISQVPASADLVIAAYALAELPESQASDIASHLWSKTHQALVLVEPGTPAGFARLRLARTVLIEQGATIAAPCPHMNGCAMSGTDWCHFSVRLARSRTHMRAKGATVPFEDERFSFLVASRLPADPAVTRVISPTQVGKTGVKLRLCSQVGVIERSVSKREGATFKRAKKTDWGDAWDA